jgi:hypothetical protein
MLVEMATFIQSVDASPDREFHHLVDLVPPDEVSEREPLQLDDEGVGEPPDGHLFGGLSVLLTGRAIPTYTVTRNQTGYQVSYKRSNT